MTGCRRSPMGHRGGRAGGGGRRTPPPPSAPRSAGCRRRPGTPCAGCVGHHPRVGSKPRLHLLVSSSSLATMTVPTYLNAFVDDAAIFPPGNAPLEQAVADHVNHRDKEYADLVGGFVVSDVKIADLAQTVGGRAPSEASDQSRPLGVNVVV